MPLVVLRPGDESAAPFAAPAGLLAVAICGLWEVGARRFNPTRQSDGNASAAPPSATPRWRLRAAACTCLFLLTTLAFYRPMLRQHWAGYDELRYFSAEEAQFWSTLHDSRQSRPLLFSLAVLARDIGPQRIEVFLWLTVALWLANGLLLTAIVKEHLPRGSPVPWLAGALLILSHNDPYRYIAMFGTMAYQTALFYFQVALWLFLVSARTQCRWLLAVSGLFLGAGLFCNEGLYPLALLCPVLLWVAGVRGHGFRAWTRLWLGVVGVLALRYFAFVYFTVQPLNAIYQGRVAKHAWGAAEFWPGTWEKLLSAWSYFRFGGINGAHLWYCAAAAALAAALGWIVTRPVSEPVPKRRLAAAAAFGLAAFVLGLVPFLPLVHSLSRALFFATPGVALLLASAACLAADLLPRPAARAALTAFLVYVAVVATAESHREQDASGPDRFAILSHIMEQVPPMRPDTLVLVVADDPGTYPLHLLATYTLPTAAERTAGTPIFLVNTNDTHGVRVVFENDIVRAASRWTRARMRYDKIVAFRLDDAWGLRLLPTLPAGLLPPTSEADRYAPLSRFVPAAPGPVPYFVPPLGGRTLRDIFSRGDGVLLGRGWSRLDRVGRRPFRWAGNGAELVVIPRGGRATIEIPVEAGPGCRSGKPTIDVVDDAGRVTASLPLAPQGETRLTVPVPPDRVAALRLRLRSEAGVGDPGSEDADERLFRVFGRGPVSEEIDKPWGWLPDVPHDGLYLLGEVGIDQVNGVMFRGVKGEAAFRAGLFAGPGSEIVFDVEPFPAPAGKTRQVRIVDEAGRTLAGADVGDRRLLRARLPADSRPGAGVRLVIDRPAGAAPADAPYDLRLFGYRAVSAAER